MSGRSAEIELFRSALDDASDPSFSVLHIQGPGGVGKTTLLEAFGVVAAGVGATVVHLDGSDLDPSPVSVLESLEGTLAIPSGGGAILPSEGIGRLVMLVDAYEQLMPLDHWFRARLLPRLPASALIVIAGRDTATQAWRTDPTWGALLRVVLAAESQPRGQSSLFSAKPVSTHACTSRSCASATGIHSAWRCWPILPRGVGGSKPMCAPP